MCKIKKELLAYAMQNAIENKIENMNIDINSIAIEVLEKIQKVLIESYNDVTAFYTVEKIISIFYEYDLDCGDCHDFG